MSVMEEVDLEKKFKCSAWNPEFTPDQVIEKYVRIGQECKLECQSTLQHQLEIPYGDRPGMTYDIYGTDLPASSPAFVFIHGGYWQISSKSENLYIVKRLVEAGVRVYMIGYDLCPKVTLEELHDEVEKGLAAVLLRIKEDNCSKVILSGHSAGACLALSMLSKNRKIPHANLLKTVYLLGGVFDVSQLRFTDEINKDNLLSISDDNVEKLSPLLQVYSHLQEVDTKISVVIAEFDAVGLVQHGHMMFAKLTSEGANTEVLTAKGFDHFDLVNELRDPECFLTKIILKECLDLDEE